jgi:cyclopropane fatty-acyl-phospholipid synthase-like methyltransferase
MNESQENQEQPTDHPNLRYIHAWHYDMLVSHERNQYYNELIKAHCRDKVVLEIGTGSGLLAVLCVRAGAKKVICCEENPLLAMAAQQLFKRLKLEDRIQLIPKNSNDIKTDEIPPADVILHELFASDPFGEHMVPILTDAQRFMKPDAIFLPEKIQILYKPIYNTPLPEKLYFDDIELLEMTALLSQIHPGLRAKESDEKSEIFALPVVSVKDLLKTPYKYEVTNDKLVGVDAVAVSFYIIDGDRKFQAASFEKDDMDAKRVHWYPLVFYKLDVDSNKLQFFAKKDQTQLAIL